MLTACLPHVHFVKIDFVKTLSQGLLRVYKCKMDRACFDRTGAIIHGHLDAILQSSASNRCHPTKFLITFFCNFLTSFRQLSDDFSLHLSYQNARAVRSGVVNLSSCQVVKES